MPADDSDFAAYLAARWPFLVRTVVLLGSPQPEAEEVASTALARCHTGWRQVREADDVDAHVYRMLLLEWRGRQRRGRGGAVPEQDPQPTGQPTGQPTAGEDPLVRMRLALEAQLAGLTPEQREVLVLRFVAGLDDLQVGDVLDVPADVVRARVRTALAGIDLAALREMTGR
ncbi:sigma factor-like helix-turn-helix DNA-binding protein [Nocardioides sp.]|uniref:sigma factor-like helix-turn-helix DNA-binding protein n=1 Tax=Nocardioides sp. TaxID=35761 RepID=UPI003784126F